MTIDVARRSAFCQSGGFTPAKWKRKDLSRRKIWQWQKLCAMASSLTWRAKFTYQDVCITPMIEFRSLKAYQGFFGSNTVAWVTWHKHPDGLKTFLQHCCREMQDMARVTQQVSWGNISRRKCQGLGEGKTHFLFMRSFWDSIPDFKNMLPAGISKWSSPQQQQKSLWNRRRAWMRKTSQMNIGIRE